MSTHKKTSSVNSEKVQASEKKQNVSYELARAFAATKLEVFDTAGAYLHFHPSIEMLVVQSGKISVTINSETRVLQRGDIAFADSFDAHAYQLLEKSAGGIVLIPDSSSMQPLAALKDSRVLCSSFLIGSEVFERVEPLVMSLKKNVHSDCELYNNSIALAVIALVTSTIGYDKKRSRQDENVMRDILAYIHGHYDENLSVIRLSKMFGYTPNHFSHIFNSYTHTGFKEYLNSVRVDCAAAAINDGGKILDVAMRSGFDSLRTFYRAFYQRYQTTPKKYQIAKKS